MNFAELKSKIIGSPGGSGSAFPQGPPENLIEILYDRLAEGMIATQRWIPCYQQKHVDVYPSCSLMFQNGTSVITKPPGEIIRVYTIGAEAGGWDQAVPLVPVSIGHLRKWMAKFRRNARWIYREPRIASGDQGFTLPSSTLDSPGGRSMTGVYSIDRHTGRLIVGPWLQSTEKLVVEWSGIKQEWKDEDIIPSDPAFLRLIRLWIQYEYGKDFASPDLVVRKMAFEDEQADQMVVCQRENQLNGDMPEPEELTATAIDFEANPPVEVADVASSVRICFVGDTGTADSNAQAVASAVTAQAPDYVVLLGDVVYHPNTPAQALAPWQDLIDAGKLVAALGNHDLDLGQDTVAEEVGNPGNGRYFSIALGSVEVFVANSGFNTDGDVVEEDGNFAGSAQWTALQSMVARSCARWKFLCLHHAPYTSGTRYTPGIEAMRWASNMDVNAVLAGHSHNYERGTFLNRLHFVVGTGGSTVMDGFGTPIEGSEVRVSGEYGFLMVDCTQSEAKWQFINVAGTVRDTLTKTDDLGPSIQVGPTPGVPPTQTQFAEFETRDEMLASTSSWQTARVVNWDAGDGIITTWEKIASSSVLPNGTDILMTNLGQPVVRTFARENASDVILPSPSGNAYQAAAVIGFPTYDDLQNSSVSAPWVIAFDSQGSLGVFQRVTDSDPEEGVNTIINAAGIHYRRRGFV